MSNLYSSDFSLSNSGLLKFSPLEPRIQSHLVKVYQTLAASMLAATVGITADIYFRLNGLLSFLAVIGLIIWLEATPKQEIRKRFTILMGLCFCNGLSLGPLVNLALYVDYRVLVTAFLGTLSVFMCLTGAAMFAKRRQYIFLGGFLSSALSLMALVSFARLIIGSRGFPYVEVYGGLLVFSGYVLFDTQLVIEKASRGDDDFIGHSVSLFLDFVALFVRILIILLKKEESEKKSKKRS
eukprot:CAMPEP_0196655720 /NCGR_PEP_ID=MMETSP1086-20130531/6648_1 /TAXON_ID=77921 /ORGANISM="Cyanoptyche  gloeocystis , Strain SAG4.97" /LENGTH=238 /DNA_ID=CAMNT_0041988181 /DNA_START=101 /DNA_END=817 /DNA_ORIENTATION=+